MYNVAKPEGTQKAAALVIAIAQMHNPNVFSPSPSPFIHHKSTIPQILNHETNSTDFNFVTNQRDDEWGKAALQMKAHYL